jgi:DNA-binding NtrC family response regulator
MATSRHSPACPLPIRSIVSHLSKETDTDDLGMVGASAAMQRLRLQVRRIGPHFRAVLVNGEPGTGKELAARALHGMSRGAEGPFVVCDAATLDTSTIEDNDVRASSDRIAWLMHTSRQGTLFLDGIGEMPLEIQARLLRVLRRYEWAQEGSAGQGIGTRIIASTDQDLRILASTGRFRVELYQKIAMVGIALPPLRERMEDVEELAMHFLGRFARAYGKRVDTISDAVMERLRGHGWPGNVREMETVVRYGVLQSEGGVLEIQHLPLFEETALDAGSTASGTARLQDVVERHVLHVLKSCDGNKLRAAEMLGISRSTLYRMLDGSGAGGMSSARYTGD